MKITVLNESFLKDKHIARLKKLGELEMFAETTTLEQAVERLSTSDVAIIDCYVTPLKKQLFEQGKNLKYITINSTGYDLVDLAAAKEYKITISNLPGYSTEAVAEHAIALLFAINRKIVLMDKRMRVKPYEIDPADTTQEPLLGFNLKGRTIGIIGLGSIGQRVAEIAHGIGMKVIAYNRSPKTIAHVTMVTLEELFKTSDVISIHTPLNADSENLITEKELALMQPHALLINTARGKVINTQALYTALKEHKIGGAGIDVLAEWDQRNPLLSLDNIILSPHAAWFTSDSFESLADMVVDNVEAYVQGTPVHVITS